MIYIVDRTPERAECWRQILRRQMLFARVVPWSELSPAPDARARGRAPTDAEAVLLSTAGCSASDAETVRRCFSVRPLCPTPEEVFVPSFGSIDRPNAPEEGAEPEILRCPDSPSDVAECLAVIVERRGRDATVLRAGPLTDDRRRKDASWEGRPLPLSPTQRLVLRLLLWVRDEGCTVEDIKYFCLKTGDCCTDGNVPAHVSQINRRLARWAGERVIVFADGRYSLSPHFL